MKWLSRASFSEHRWSGWMDWLKHVCAFALVAGFVSELVLARDTQALFDTMSVVLLWPLLTVCVCLLLGLICMRLWNTSLHAALAYLATILPCIFVVPFIQLLESEFFGVHDQVTFVGTGHALISLLTGGIFPTPVAPLGVAFVWICVCMWFGWSWWKTTPGRTPRELLRAFFPVYVGFAGLWLIPSLIGWSMLIGHVPLLRVGGDLVEHGFVAAQIDGYAWPNVYGRFPLAIGGEAHISSQWLLATLTLLTLLALYFVHLARMWRWSLRQWLVFAERERVIRVMGLVGLGLLAAGFLSVRPLFGWTHTLAFLDLVVATGLFALVQVADVDLASASFGSLSHDRPLSAGLVRSSDLIEAKHLWRGMAYVMAWLLGWPILVSFALADLAHLFSLTTRGSWAYLSWHALSCAGFFLAGWMVIAERGSFGALAPALALFVSLANFGWNWRRPTLDARGKRC